jgi:hypothetical protein
VMVFRFELEYVLLPIWWDVDIDFVFISSASPSSSRLWLLLWVLVSSIFSCWSCWCASVCFGRIFDSIVMCGVSQSSSLLLYDPLLCWFVSKSSSYSFLFCSDFLLVLIFPIYLFTRWCILFLYLVLSKRYVFGNKENAESNLYWSQPQCNIQVSLGRGLYIVSPT